MLKFKNNIYFTKILKVNKKIFFLILCYYIDSFFFFTKDNTISILIKIKQKEIYFRSSLENISFIFGDIKKKKEKETNECSDYIKIFVID